MRAALAERQCETCLGDEVPLPMGELAMLIELLPDGWKIEKGHHLRKAFAFDDVHEAEEFTKRVEALAEEQGQEPDLIKTWGLIVIQVWTKKIDGLTENDFIFAAKVDAVS
jgi:4a-hydroxytetrahydrobiopterin dehydratase